MQSMNLHGLVHWIASHEILLAVVITAAVALLLVCCLECSHCSCRDRDELFNRHEV